MIQIDGLSRNQMERAMNKGNLPFLSRLIKRRHFSLETFYSGVPSTTPAVQAEIFYGVRSAVPAFHFLHRKSGAALRMYEADAAARIEDRIKESGAQSIIEGGHSYSNIYRAGAERSRYCSEDFAPNEILKQLHPFKSLILLFVYAPKILRMALLAIIELFIAIVDMIKGLYARKNFVNEIKFVPTRVGVCILLRELIRFRILLDIERGERVIHANLLGYDEQAHRRGPGSAFAHWTLKGIDRTIRDIYEAAHRSDYRDYELLIYSDHGQEHTESFFKRHDRNVEDAVREVLAKGPLRNLEVWKRAPPGPELLGDQFNRCRNILGLPLDPHLGIRSPTDLKDRIVLTAMGPLGHLYFPKKQPLEICMEYAKDLVASGGIPMVLVPRAEAGPLVFNSRGQWQLPADGAEIFGAGHPFLDEVTEDAIRLCNHVDAGDLVISGWDRCQRPLSFPHENGAHGGPGPEETRGFLLVPDRIRRWHLAHLPNTGDRVRGEELREIALHYLGNDGIREERVPEHAPVTGNRTLRIMTYNIHSCRGVDGKIRPERVARVINDFDPDIVAVQEVDAHRPRTGGYDQAQVIADHLRMTHVFQAMLEEEKERYGIAVFSKYPFETVKTGFLTKAVGKREARGAISLRIAPEGKRPFYLVNSHFGLGRNERKQQIIELLGENWLGGIMNDEPVILCGDFNSGPRSMVYKTLSATLIDAWQAAGGYKIKPGFPSVKPFLRLDHIFVTPHFEVKHVEVPNTPTAKVASDHLPLCVELSY